MRRTALVMLVLVLLIPAGHARADCTRVASITLGECQGRKKKKPQPHPDDLSASKKAEVRLIELINEERHRRGLRPLAPHANGRDVARRHSRRMAKQGRAFHNQHLDSPETRRKLGYPDEVAENVGFGPTADSVHEAFMSSDAHRHNILSRSTDVGLGVISDGHSVWVTQIYMRGGGPGPSSLAAASGGGARARDRGQTQPAPVIPELPGGLAALGRQALDAASARPLPWGWMAIAVVALAVPGSIRTLTRVRPRR